MQRTALTLHETLMPTLDFNALIEHNLVQTQSPFDALSEETRLQLIVAYLLKVPTFEAWEILENILPQLPQLLGKWLIKTLISSPDHKTRYTNKFVRTLRQSLLKASETLIRQDYDTLLARRQKLRGKI